MGGEEGRGGGGGGEGKRVREERKRRGGGTPLQEPLEKGQMTLFFRCQRT